METKFTPGPWTIEGAAIVTDGVVLALCSSTKENAKLIAAAPDLLEACKQLRQLLDDVGFETEFPELIAAEQAIEKATK